MNDLLRAADIEERARAAGLTIKTMCERAGIAESTFARWKRGAHRPNIETYQKLIDVVSGTDRAAV